MKKLSRLIDKLDRKLDFSEYFAGLSCIEEIDAIAALTNSGFDLFGVDEELV